MLLSIGGSCLQSIIAFRIRLKASSIQLLLLDWMRFQVLLRITEPFTSILLHLVKLASLLFEMLCSVQVLVETSYFEHAVSLTLWQTAYCMLNRGLLQPVPAVHLYVVDVLLLLTLQRRKRTAIGWKVQICPIKLRAVRVLRWRSHVNGKLIDSYICCL